MLKHLLRVCMTLISVLGLGWAAHAQSLFTEDFENENPVNANDLCVSGGEYTPADANWALGPACSVPTNGTPKLVERFGTTYLEYNRKYPADSEVFNSKAIDVTDIDNVRIQFNVLSEGGLESTGNGKDKFRMYAVLDGAEYLIYSKNGHVGSVTDPAGQGVNNSYAMDSHDDSFDVSGGSSLMLRLEVKITDGGNNKESYMIDDLSMCVDNNDNGTCDCDETLAFDPPLADATVECLDDLPTECDATQGATRGDVSCVLGSAQSSRTECVATTAMGTGADGAIVLFDIDGDAQDDRFFMPTDEGMTLTQYDNGVAVVTGQVADVEDEDAILNVNIVYENGVSGADWTGGFKVDENCPATSAITDSWMIYILNSGVSFLTGEGNLDGTVLQLSHAPAGEYFGFQVGEMANDRNCNEGAGGWFSYAGLLNGEEIQGAQGDLLLDITCSTSQSTPCAEDAASASSVTLFYAAFDEDCGDVILGDATTTRLDTEAPTFNNAPENVTVSCEDGLPEVPTDLTASDNCENSDSDAPTVTMSGQTAPYKSDLHWFLHGGPHFHRRGLLRQPGDPHPDHHGPRHRGPRDYRRLALHS